MTYIDHRARRLSRWAVGVSVSVTAPTGFLLASALLGSGGRIRVLHLWLIIVIGVGAFLAFLGLLAAVRLEAGTVARLQADQASGGDRLRAVRVTDYGQPVPGPRVADSRSTVETHPLLQARKP